MKIFLTRILVKFGALIHVLHVLHEGSDALNPGLSFLFWISHQVQVSSTATKHQSETAVSGKLIRHAEERLGLMSLTNSLHITDGDWTKMQFLTI